jgi:uncharacterized protein
MGTKTMIQKSFLFYLAHPAHYHLFKNIIKLLKQKGHTVLITIKSKDVLSKLLVEEGVTFINVAVKVRKDNKLGILNSVIKRNIRHFILCLKYRPDFFISSSAEFSPLSRILNITYINVFEDDLILFKNYRRFLGPFVNTMICPNPCNNGNLNAKTVKYSGYQELAYLRPKYFKPDHSIVEKYFSKYNKNFIIRFAKLTAWHDEGKSGLTTEIAKKLIALLQEYGNVFITSERELPEEFERYRLPIKASDMHHFLYYADLYVGDSQTMTVEAAVLGTPALRFNDFVGELGCIEELEYKYNLTYGFKTNEPEKLYEKIKELLNIVDLKKIWETRRNDMLEQTIDLSEMIVWLMENYPQSIKIISENPDYQFNFK